MKAVSLISIRLRKLINNHAKVHFVISEAQGIDGGSMSGSVIDNRRMVQRFAALECLLILGLLLCRHSGVWIFAAILGAMGLVGCLMIRHL